MSLDEQPRAAHASHTCARNAVRHIRARLAPPPGATVLFFCSSQLDLEALTDELKLQFTEQELIGCTTAGEIGPDGYLEKSLVAVCLPPGQFACVTGRLEQLRQFNHEHAQAFAASLQQQLHRRAPQASAANCFGFLLIDGLSQREARVIHALQAALAGLPLVGGSAGDDLRFQHARVFHRGRFHEDSAILLLAATSLPFQTFTTQHFRFGEEQLRVTEADPDTQRVIRLNDRPADQEYARLLGVPTDKLSPAYFAAAPVMVQTAQDHFLRSFYNRLPDGSLCSYGPIEEGATLRAAGALGLVENLRDTFAGLQQQLGKPSLMLVCDCFLRKKEISQRGMLEAVSSLLRQQQAVGFSSYGEQFHGNHINQTLTGIVFGQSGPPQAE